ncbi:sigma-70 family RNA polymerase sigma factor [Geothrix campi]|jgi:RNA polymerase sigma-70 factor (ECF subfamily)|uniref:sigma-70 family RNA polymerase sigma factor n=1 Tax=Geothrix campi TaxID=2966450 RepID=UPI0021479100|nr:sigma-70 family RNA polymerase sigma factor [Geothrix sp. SG10]
MDSTALAEAFEAHRKLLWGLSYRMTGSPADADDVVQETFLRALKRPPADQESPLRPWLAAIAVNLSKDLLRRRKSRPYPGVWLPGPVEWDTSDYVIEAPQEHFDLLETGSYSFLVALEDLSPQQRAVFLLREVFDHSVDETARLLGISESNVKVTLHRARKVLKRPSYPTSRKRELTGRALRRFQEALATQDLETLESLFTPDAKACGDGGGIYASAEIPILGARAIAQFFLLIAQQDPSMRLQLREINGLPAQVGERDVPETGPRAPRWVLLVEVDAEGRIAWVRSVLAPRKLTRISWEASKP